MDDLISRQAVLNLLHALPPEEATTKALLIQSVKQMSAPDNLVKDSQGLVKDLVNDTISRQAVIDLLKQMRKDGDMVPWEGKDVFARIRKLPSAQPERKRGKWIYNSPVTMKCDQCGLVIKDWDWHRFKFCPNCDCDMRGE